MTKLSTKENTNNTKTTQPLIAAAYVRVSTKRQEDEETEQVQIAEVQARAARDGYTLQEKNIFIDKNWSGAILKRPGLDKMRTAAYEDQFQILYAYDRGRIARKYAYQEIVIEELEDRRIKFIPLHDKEIETEEDRLFQGMQGLFAEWERFKIADRFRIAKLRRAEGGRLIHGHALYGYQIKRTPGESGEKKDELREYAINEEEARVVRLIFAWFVDEHVSLRQIIERLHIMKIPPRKQKQEHWTKGPLERLLTCETYVNGKIYFNKNEACVPQNPTNKEEYRKIKKSSRRTRPREEWIEHPHPVPTILPNDGTFEKAQEILQENKSRKAKNRKRTYLLSGKCYCGCGHRRVGDPGGNGNRYYRCAQRIYKHPKPSECVIRGINTAALDKDVWARIEDVMTDPTNLKKAAELEIKEDHHASQSLRESGEIKKLIKKVEGEQERYAKAYGSGDMPFEQYRRFNRDAERRIKSYQAQLEDLEQESSRSADNIGELCEAAARVLKRLKKQNRELLISHAVKKVVIYEKDVELVLHIPLPSTFLSVKLQYRAKSRNNRLAQRG